MAQASPSASPPASTPRRYVAGAPSAARTHSPSQIVSTTVAQAQPRKRTSWRSPQVQYAVVLARKGGRSTGVAVPPSDPAGDAAGSGRASDSAAERRASVGFA